LRSKFEGDLNYWVKRGKFDTKLRPSYTTQQLFDEMNNVQNMINKRGRFTGKDPIQNSLAEIKTYLRNKLYQGVELAEMNNPGSTVIDQLKKARRDYWITSDIRDSISKKAIREADSSIVSLKELISGGALSLATGNLGVGAAAAAAVRFAQSDLKARLTILSQINKSKIANDKYIKSALELYTKGAAASKIAAHNIKRIIPTTSISVLNSLNLDPKKKKNESEKDKLQAFHNFRKQLENLHNNPEELLHILSRKTLLLNKVAPLTADALEATTINGIAFLYEKMPRPMKDTIGLQSNLQQYRVSNFELAKYERYVEAVANPMSVMRNLAEGKISREGVEAIKVVYPTMFQHIQSQILEQVGSMDEVLPYQKRVQLSIVFEVPLDESMESANVIGLQQQFGAVQQQREAQAASAQSTQMTNSARILSNSSIAEREASNAQKIERS
jgi:hypothetical protein